MYRYDWLSAPRQDEICGISIAMLQCMSDAYAVVLFLADTTLFCLLVARLLAVERPPKVEVHCPHRSTPLTLQDTSVKVAPEAFAVRVLPWPPDDPEGNVLVGRSGGEDDELRVGIVGDALDVVCGSLGLVAAYGQAIRLRVTTLYRRWRTIPERG
jgi:hypothetical protein